MDVLFVRSDVLMCETKRMSNYKVIFRGARISASREEK